MVSIGLANGELLYDPSLNLEETPELPGKEVMRDLLDSLSKKQNVCSKLIQDSHGWCFNILGSDSRHYQLELIYLYTDDTESNWVLSCSRGKGFRIWEYFKDDRVPLGLEQDFADMAVELLSSRHEFEISDTD